MKRVEIHYNPYKLQTVVAIDNKRLETNSNIYDAAAGRRLQEWVDNLPQLLVAENNDNDNSFEITFYGMQADAEDLQEVLVKAIKDGTFSEQTTLEAVPSKISTAERQKKVEECFERIKNCQFDELKSEDMIEAFEKAKNSEIDICVVGTMSAGKSTLFNALLRDKLMPSKSEACTATVTRIKNTTDENVPFKYKAFDENHKLIDGKQGELTYDVMTNLNDNDKVYEIHVEGNIPIVSSNETQLILIDTPGPNNARNKGHEKLFYSLLDKSSKPMLIFLTEPTNYQVNDNKELLNNIAKRMSSGGKQSRDRFMFVLNKMDMLDPDEDDISDIVGRLGKFIVAANEEHPIENPIVYGVSALPAMNIRLSEKNVDIGRKGKAEMRTAIENLNDIPELHLEKYALDKLPSSLQDKIKKDLAQATAKNDSIDNPQTALIHTGITAIEAAIRQYVEKYAQTAKIKTLVDTFFSKLVDRLNFENMQKEIRDNEEKRDEYVAQIKQLKKNMADGERANKFREKIKAALQQSKIETTRTVDAIVQTLNKELTSIASKQRGKEIQELDAERARRNLEKLAKKLVPRFESELDAGIQKSLVNVGTELLNEYRRQLKSLTQYLGSSDEILINPLKLMGNSVDFDIDVEDFVRTRDVTKEKDELYDSWVDTSPWFNPFGLFDSGHYTTKVKKVKYTEKQQYITGDDVFEEFSLIIQMWVDDNRREAENHANEESQKIAARFQQEFDKLDRILQQKLQDLEKATTQKNQTSDEIAQQEQALAELQSIKNDIEKILAI
ncbi:MAG: dynamin family protein [Firmicutes bacterium]|nr:dynamin family protein [Bacillota bacterium]